MKLDASAVRRFLGDPGRPGSLADRARTQRRERLLATFPDIERMTVLDMGGTAEYWQHARLTPADLTLLNLTDVSAPGVRMLVGDACDPPREVYDRSYDLVLCNSVIDQVGGLARRRMLAARIMELAPHYWVQAANRGFPVDAYFMFPWFSRLPVGARVAIVQRWRLTDMHTTDPNEARQRVLAIELQTRGDLRDLFPDARVVTERFGGVAKSLIAVRA
ncbi:MAG: hypothetical protein LBJ87_03100 [bacterium]|nr:hypothetical protein [bacterium]